jgi:hypothetical protein
MHGAATRIALAIAVVALPANAQQPDRFAPARTLDGRPDLQGMWVGDYVTQLERPEGVATRAISAEEAAKLVAAFNEPQTGAYDPDNLYFVPNKVMRIDGELRSSFIVEPADGMLPLTALAKLAQQKTFELWGHGFDNPEERPGGERCVSSFGHPPIRSLGVLLPNLIVQTPDAIVIATEDTDSARIIHLSGAAPGPAIKSRAGYSAGRWEGDTLVVETTHLAAIDPAGSNQKDDIVTSEASLIRERFTLLSPTELLYQFSVDDPSLYARTWLAELVLTRTDEATLYEYACHEGNRAMVNILLAARLGKQKANTSRLKF